MNRVKHIDIDLSTYKIALQFENATDSLILHFDTPSRKFYLALIALIVHEMKQQDSSGYINIRNYEKHLKFFDDALAESHASKTIDGMWEKIRKAWNYSLPNLEEAAHFKIEGRDVKPPYEKGGKYIYECSDIENNTWANLFGIDNVTNKWRFRFAFDTANISSTDVELKYEDLQDGSAWDAFLKQLEESTIKELSKETAVLSPKKRWSFYAIAAAIAFILIVGSVTILNRYLRSKPSPIAETAVPRASITVLPFLNISDESDKDYFCDGLTEELINSLARVNDLHVISRTSAFYFKDKGFDLRTIGEKLGVDNILEGSVRVSGDNLEISAQLIKVADDSHLWADTYDRKMKDIFDTQENLAKEIACSLKSSLGCEEDEIIAKHYTENIAAYNLYLRGRYLWNKDSHKEAIVHYEKALELDPNYALAYGGLADSYTRLAFWFSDSREYYKLKAIAAAIKAVEIDETLSEAHTSIGIFKLLFEWDWKGAEESFKKAISLNPGNSIAHTYYGHLLRATDRVEKAVVELSIALELDPFSRRVNVIYGMMLHVSGQIDKSINHLKSVLELFPDSPEASMLLGRIFVENGNYEEGFKLLEHALELSNKKSPFPTAFLGYSYGIAGQENKANELLKEAIDRWQKGHFPAGFIALITIGLGDKEETFKWLQIAFDERRSSNFALRTIPMYKGLHSDPRWAELMKKMGHEL